LKIELGNRNFGDRNFAAEMSFGSVARNAAWRAGVWGILGTLAPALVDLSTSDWFGAGDLRALGFFTLPLLLILAISGVGLAKTLAQRPRWIALLLGGTVGTGIGFLWTLANAWLLGGWFGAWSFPVLLCWTTGGALSQAAAATARPGGGWRRSALESGVYLVLATAVLFVYRPAVVHLGHDQHLTLVYGRIRPTTAASSIDDSRELLVAAETELLARAQIAGSIEIVGGHAANTTERPRARILVLLRRPVDRVYRLLADRAVEFYPANTKETRYWVEHVGGARSGGSGLQW
jgi:hypothetical protein